MKKTIFILAVIAMIAFTPMDVGAISTQLADVSPATLAPSQRDINIAVLVVILGSVLVGYEKVAHERQTIKARKRHKEHSRFIGG
jgi:hypothetical protein